MNDWDNFIVRYFLRDRQANNAILPLLERGVPLCMLADAIEQYARQTVAIFPHNAVNWTECANFLLMEHYGAIESGEPIAEWSDQFDQSEY